MSSVQFVEFEVVVTHTGYRLSSLTREHPIGRNFISLPEELGSYSFNVMEGDAGGLEFHLAGLEDKRFQSVSDPQPGLYQLRFAISTEESIHDRVVRLGDVPVSELELSHILGLIGGRSVLRPVSSFADIGLSKPKKENTFFAVSPSVVVHFRLSEDEQRPFFIAVYYLPTASADQLSRAVTAVLFCGQLLVEDDDTNIISFAEVAAAFDYEFVRLCTAGKVEEIVEYIDQAFDSVTPVEAEDEHSSCRLLDDVINGLTLTRKGDKATHYIFRPEDQPVEPLAAAFDLLAGLRSVTGRRVLASLPISPDQREMLEAFDDESGVKAAKFLDRVLQPLMYMREDDCDLMFPMDTTKTAGRHREAGELFSGPHSGEMIGAGIASIVLAGFFQTFPELPLSSTIPESRWVHGPSSWGARSSRVVTADGVNMLISDPVEANKYIGPADDFVQISFDQILQHGRLLSHSDVDFSEARVADAWRFWTFLGSLSTLGSCEGYFNFPDSLFIKISDGLQRDIQVHLRSDAYGNWPGGHYIVTCRIRRDGDRVIFHEWEDSSPIPIYEMWSLGGYRGSVPTFSEASLVR